MKRALDASRAMANNDELESNARSVALGVAS
jgi:hypothetical protein